MQPVLAMTDRLCAELPQMLAEHRQIVGALEELSKAASADGRPEISQFAQALRLHAETEEQVLYPAALLVGEMVRRGLSA